jgi:hypothetical protein
MRHRHPDHVRSSLLAQRAAQMRYQLNPAEAALWAEINGIRSGNRVLTRGTAAAYNA